MKVENSNPTNFVWLERVFTKFYNLSNSMKIREIIEKIDGKIVSGEDKLDVEVERGFAADLLSDVLALTEEKACLITGITGPQVIRVAEVLDIPLIIIARGKQPSKALVEAAKLTGIPVVLTNKTVFETCGILYASGVKPCKIKIIQSSEETNTCLNAD
jgi:predicted transcriptional regulator